MGKYDVIDIVFISLISFYLLIFSLILILLIRKHHGIRGLFRYLLDKNSITITNNGEVIENIDENNNIQLSKKNKLTIKQFFEKRLKSLKKDIADELTDKKSKKKVKTKAKSKKKPTTKKKTTSKKPATKKKTTNAKKKTTTVKKPATKKATKKTNSKKSNNTKKKIATKKTSNNKKTTSKKK